MDRILSSFKLNNILLCCVLATFSIAVLAPPPAYAQVGFNKIAFGLRIERLVEKMWKYKDRLDKDKLIETMLEIKWEIEAATGQVINLDKELDKVEAEIKKKTNKVPKKDFKEVRSEIKKKERRLHQRSLCMASYYDEAPSVSFSEYEALTTAARGVDDGNQAECKDLPLRLAVGITMMLAGGFLCMAGAYLALPPCVYAGEQLAIFGAGFAADSYIGVFEN